MKRIFNILFVVLIIISFSNVLLFSMEENKDDQMKKWESIVNFGIPSAQKDMIDSIVQKKIEASYKFITELLKKEVNAEIIKKCLIATSILNYSEPAQIIFDLSEKYIKSQDYDLLGQCYRTLGTLKYEPAYEKVVLALDNSNDRLKYASIEALGNYKSDKCLDKLYEVYKSADNKDLKHTLIIAIGKIASDKSLEFLLEVGRNKSSDKLLRNAAIRSILNYTVNDEKIKKSIIEIYPDEDEQVSLTLLKIISKFNSNESIDIILKSLKEERATVRLQSINSIIENKLNQAIPNLLYIVENDKIPIVRNGAFSALLMFGGAEIDKIIEDKIFGKKKDPFYIMSFLKNCDQYDQAKVSPILIRLYEQETLPKAKMEIIKLCDKMKADRTIELYEKILKAPAKNSNDSYSKSEIIKNISMLNEPKVTELFKIALNDKSVYVRAKAVYYSSVSPLKEVQQLVKETYNNEKNIEVLLEFVRYFKRKGELNLIEDIKKKVNTTTYSQQEKNELNRVLLNKEL